MTFEVGKTYFSVFYADTQLTHPVFETLVYLGPDSADNGDALHLFQYAASFHSDGNWNGLTEEARAAFDEPPIVGYAPDHAEPVVDADGLIQELRECNAPQRTVTCRGRPVRAMDGVRGPGRDRQRGRPLGYVR
jgi:hypothetical protein